jgi:citrate lyase beta subunit
LRRIIRAPADESDLVARALTRLQLIFDIEDGIATTDSLLAASVLALCIQELVAECVVVRVFGCLLNDDLFPVVANLVDDPFDILAELELVERANALGGYRDTAIR